MYFSPVVIKVIISEENKTGEACTASKGMHKNFNRKTCKEERSLANLGLDKRILGSCILNKDDVRVWLALTWLRRGSIGICYGYGAELSGSVRAGDFLTS